MTKKNPAAISRRDMLGKTTAMAATAVAAPYIIPASALGLNGFTAPSERITLAMIGLGMMMKGHMKAMLNHDGVQILAVCDVDRTKREKGKAEVEAKYAGQKGSGSYKGCDAYNEYEQIIARGDIDVCFVITPDHWHVPISLAAVRSGKDVYVEKPMSLTLREGRVLADAVRRYGAVLQVGSQQRSDNAFRKAAEMVRNGWIGKVHTAYARLGDFPPPRALPEQPVPEGFDYDRWLGSTPWFPFNEDRVQGIYSGGWRSFWEYGSRKNGDWGAHHYDIIQWALGRQYSGPEFFFPKGHNGSEWQGYTYRDGPTVLRDHPAETGEMIEFHGENGIIGVSRGNQLVTRPSAALKHKPLSPNEEHLYASNDHHQNFLDCVRSRKRPIADVEVGHRTATVCHLCGIAERLNRTIQWDPKTEQIIGDAEASKWLDRPRRAPYTL